MYRTIYIIKYSVIYKLKQKNVNYFFIVQHIFLQRLHQFSSYNHFNLKFVLITVTFAKYNKQAELLGSFFFK